MAAVTEAATTDAPAAEAAAADAPLLPSRSRKRPAVPELIESLASWRRSRAPPAP